MNRGTRYGSALLVAGALTGIVGVLDPNPELLFGIFGVYTLTTDRVLLYPELLWSHETPSIPSGVFAGGMTFGAVMLAQGVGGEFQFAAVILGVGLASFGLSTGYWLAKTEQPAETD